MMMPRIDQEKMDRKEFAEFVDAEPVSPRKETDAAIYRLARRNFRPVAWVLLARILLVQISSGILTLAVCPQFGIGSNTHNVLLHSFHSLGNPSVYYLSCGILFVLFGAALNGFITNRKGLISLGKSRYAYFSAYSVCAYGIFGALGAEVFLVGGIFWILGAALGNIIGFEMGVRLRGAAA
jgi:hypothetical protein